MFSRVAARLAPGKLQRWSYSAWSTHKRCPRSFKYNYIDKLKQAPHFAMERGTTIHALAESFLKGKLTGMPRPLLKIKKPLTALKKFKPGVEEFWGVDRDMRPTVKGAPSWLVAKTDAYVLIGDVLYVIDHKTGRIYPEHVDQASLYATVGYVLYPKIRKVVVEFFYIDQGETHSYTYTIAKLRYNLRYWKAQGRKLMSATEFPATPGFPACALCGYRSDRKLANGQKGPCRLWKYANDPPSPKT